MLASLQSMSFLFFSFLKKMSNLPKSFHSMSFICPHFTRPNSPNSSIFSKKKNFSFGLPWLGAYLEHPNSFSCLLCHHLFFFFCVEKLYHFSPFSSQRFHIPVHFLYLFFFVLQEKQKKKVSVSSPSFSSSMPTSISYPPRDVRLHSQSVERGKVGRFRDINFNLFIFLFF